MRKQRQNESTVLEKLILGLFRGIWFLISLPFKKRGPKAGLNGIDKQYILGKRQEIIQLLDSNNHIELKHAVMEADKLVDYVFQKKGFLGETFADRLRSGEHSMPADIYQKIWNGHKTRNQIAHSDDVISNQELVYATKNLMEYLRTL